MGLAFMLDRLGEHRVAGHDGGWPGFVSSLLVAPDAGVGVLAFTNTTAGFAPHTLAERALARLLDVPDDAETERRAVPASPHLWPELAGDLQAPARSGHELPLRGRCSAGRSRWESRAGT